MIVNRKYSRTKCYLSGFFTILFISLIPHKVYPDSLILNNVMENIPVDKHLLYIEDRTGNLTIDDIKSTDLSLFKSLPVGKINLGFSDSVFWFRLDVKNEKAEPVGWILESKYPLLDYITLYIPAEFGFIEIKSGDRMPFKSMPSGHFNFSSKIISPPGDSAIYLQVKTEGTVIVKLRAWDNESFINNTFSFVSMFWLFYGIVITIFLYNVFVYISSGDKAYLILALFIFSSMMFTFIQNGMARKYLWPDMPWLANYSYLLSSFVTIAFLIMFTQMLFNTKNELHIIHKLLNSIVIITFIMIFLSLFISYSISGKIIAIITIISSVLIVFFIMIPMFRINKRPVFYYLSSCLFFTFWTLTLSLQSFGIIPYNFSSGSGHLAGLTVGYIFLSIGVAHHLRILKERNENALSALKKSEERYRLFFETAHDGIMYCIDDIPVFANKNMMEMTGYEPDEFYKKTVYEFFSSDSITHDITETIKKILAGEITNARAETLLIKNSSIKINVLVSLSSIATGNNRGIFMIITDISSLKEASKTIRMQYEKIQNQLNSLESLNNELIAAQGQCVLANKEIEKEKEYLSATLLSIGDGVIAFDTDGYVFLMNTVAEALTGIRYKEARGKHIRDIIKLADETLQDLLFDTLGTINEKYNFNNIGIPFRIIDTEGVDRIVEINSSIIKHENKLLGIVLALRDITVKSRIDTELMKMSKLESIGILAGGIAHDFNNLLTGISGNISIIKNYRYHSEDVSDIITNIEKAVGRATGLTKQLLTFAKGGEPLLVPSSLKNIIRDSVNFIVNSPGIKCEINISDDIKTVMIDPNQISQAINNLLINSIHAMKNGGMIFISACNIEKMPREIPVKNGQYVELTISDTGCGISPKNINKIFDPFFTTKTNGTGLGLTSTFSIIKRHRGFIIVNSEENEGTTFRIYLKSTEKAVSQKDIKDGIPLKQGNGSVLIMDDETYILDILVKMLNHQGYTVDCAANGEEAVRFYTERFLRNDPYDHVILDLTVINGMGGRETVLALKKINPAIKAIVSSGYSDNPVMANYKEYGFSGVLTKPYTLEDVLKSIEKSDY